MVNISELTDSDLVELTQCAMTKGTGEHDAEDIVQHAFKLLLEQPTPPAKPMHWLKRVIRFDRVDHHRKSKRRSLDPGDHRLQPGLNEMRQDLDLIPWPRDGRSWPNLSTDRRRGADYIFDREPRVHVPTAVNEDETQSDDLCLKLVQAATRELDALSPKLREAYDYRFEREYSSSEYAREVGISPKTASSRYRRMLDQLQRSADNVCIQGGVSRLSLERSLGIRHRMRRRSWHIVITR